MQMMHLAPLPLPALQVKAPRSIAVGLLPMGTSNDFAAVIGLPQVRGACTPLQVYVTYSGVHRP